MRVERRRSHAELGRDPGERQRLEPVRVRDTARRVDHHVGVEARARHQLRSASAIARSIAAAGSRVAGPCPTRSSDGAKVAQHAGGVDVLLPVPRRHRGERKPELEVARHRETSVRGEDVAADQRARARVEIRDMPRRVTGRGDHLEAADPVAGGEPRVRDRRDLGPAAGQLASGLSPSRMRASISGTRTSTASPRRAFNASSDPT